MKTIMRLTFTLAIAAFMLLGARLQYAHAQATFFIRNAMTHQVLDLPSGITSRSMFIQQFPFNGGTNQQWFFSAAFGNCTIGGPNTIPPVNCDGYTYIYPRNSGPSRMALDIPSGSKDSGVQVQTSPFTSNSRTQQWLLVRVGINAYKIQNRQSKKFLEAPPAGSPSTLVFQNDFNYRPAQIWYFEFAAASF